MGRPRIQAYSPGQVSPGSEYTTDQVAFLVAMDRYKRTRGKVFPTWTEVLAVVESLGWRRVAAPGPLPWK